MLPEYKTKTNIGVGLGIALALLVSLLSQSADSTGLGEHSWFWILTIIFQLSALVLFVWGCRMYAKGKGYHPAWGLLGLLSCFGLLALVLFPDRHKNPKKADEEQAAAFD